MEEIFEFQIIKRSLNLSLSYNEKYTQLLTIWCLQTFLQLFLNVQNLSFIHKKKF